MKRSGELTAKQERLLAHLLAERTVEAACRNADVAVTTYWRWMKEERFVYAYRRARRDVMENTVSRLQGITLHAIDTLERNLDCENPGVATRTAAIILEHAIKGIEILDLAHRIENLEAAYEAEGVEK